MTSAGIRIQPLGMALARSLLIAALGWQLSGFGMPLAAVAQAMHLWLSVYCSAAAELFLARVPTTVLWLTTTLVAGFAVAGLASVVSCLVRTAVRVATMSRRQVAPLPVSLRVTAVALGLDTRVRLVASTEFFAFCSGLFRPMVWLSSAVLERLSSLELEAVLRHEAEHARQRDPIKFLVANSLGAAFFFVPFVKHLARSYVLEKELSADAATIRQMKDPGPLASALYTALTVHSSSAPELAVAAFSAVDARIDHLVGEPPMLPVALRAQLFRGVLVLLAIIGLIAAVCLPAMP